jgi:hypothetical protein
MQQKPILARLNANQPDLKKLSSMRLEMEALLNDPSTSSLTLEELLAFQDSDGSFKLLDSTRVPSDIRVDYCYMPTYLGSAILMREYLSGKSELASNLNKALNQCLHRNLEGHGRDAESGCIEAIKVFKAGGLREYLKYGEHICPMFHRMVVDILTRRRSSLGLGMLGERGEDYDKDWRELLEYLEFFDYRDF